MLLQPAPLRFKASQAADVQVSSGTETTLTAKEILPNNQSLIVLSSRGYLKRMPPGASTAQVLCRALKMPAIQRAEQAQSCC